jgi:hypothetical protein
MSFSTELLQILVTMQRNHQHFVYIASLDWLLHDQDYNIMSLSVICHCSLTANYLFI